MSAKSAALDQIMNSHRPLAIHEISGLAYNQNNIATRLNDLERERLLKSRFRKGKNFKEWWPAFKAWPDEPVTFPIEPTGQELMPI